MQIVALIIAILKAFPILDRWFKIIHDERIKSMEKENGDATKTSIETGDQRPIEIAMGSTKVGEKSDVPNTEIVKTLPGVK